MPDTDEPYDENEPGDDDALALRPATNVSLIPPDEGDAQPS